MDSTISITVSDKYAKSFAIRGGWLWLGANGFVIDDLINEAVGTWELSK